MAAPLLLLKAIACAAANNEWVFGPAGGSGPAPPHHASRRARLLLDSARYCKLLEDNSFRGRTTYFFYMLLFDATVLTGIVVVGGLIQYVSETLAKIVFLSNPLTFMLVYVWSKHNTFIHMSFLGLFTSTAAYLPRDDELTDVS